MRCEDMGGHSQVLQDTIVQERKLQISLDAGSSKKEVVKVVHDSNCEVPSIATFQALLSSTLATFQVGPDRRTDTSRISGKRHADLYRHHRGLPVGIPTRIVRPGGFVKGIFHL